MEKICVSFKDYGVFSSSVWVPWNPILINLFTWIAYSAIIKDIVITCGFRQGDSGVHGCDPLRGLDLRIYNDNMGNNAEKTINYYWMYDYERENKKCAIYHNVGSGWHLHLQVHPNTRRIKR